jgi:hypothetical protein
MTVAAGGRLAEAAGSAAQRAVLRGSNAGS